MFSDYLLLVINCNETRLSSDPNSSNKVSTVKGTKQVQQLTLGERGTRTTILIAVNAAEDVMPPFFYFQGHTSSTRLTIVNRYLFDMQ